MKTQPVITINNLKKHFSKTKALDGVSFQVARGEVMGFLGPNGSGKSTTIRILLGMLKANEGAATVFGLDPWSDAVQLHRCIAYVPGEVNLWPKLTGGETVDFLARLHHVNTRDKKYQDARAKYAKLFEADLAKKNSDYSKGNRQKIALIAAFAIVDSDKIDLLILDEPTSGLDPLMEEAFAGVIRDLKRREITVLLSSHILSEVENLCDSATIIRQGRVIKTGTIKEIKASHRTGATLESAFLSMYTGDIEA